jgi:hypothetical protein
MKSTQNTGLQPIGCTVREATQISGLGRTELYDVIRKKKVQAKKSGSRTIVIVESLRDYVLSLPDFDPTNPPPEARAMLRAQKERKAAKAGAA